MNDLLGQVKSDEQLVAGVSDLKLDSAPPKPTATPKPAVKAAPVGQENADANVDKKKKKKVFGFLKRGHKSEDGVKAGGSAAVAAVAIEPEPEEEEEEEEQEPALTQQFMSEVSKVKDLLNKIHTKRVEVEQLHENVKNMTKTAEIQAAQQKIDKELTTIKQYANTAKASVEQMNNEANGSTDMSSGADRMRSTIVSGLMTRLKRELDGFRTFEAHVRTEYRDVVERRLRVVTGQEVDEDTVEHMIDSGEAENVFRKAMQLTTSAAVVDVLNQTNERYEGMKKLTEDLINLHQMMLDFSVLVAEQGMMIDNIEAQVGQAADFIADGTNQVIAAKGHKKTKDKYKSAAVGTAGAAAGTAATVGALKIAGTAGALAL